MHKRLARLEEQARETTENEEGVISRDALTRVTDKDLRLLHAYFKRATEGDTEPTEEEGAALGRYRALREEVRSERTQTA